MNGRLLGTSLQKLLENTDKPNPKPSPGGHSNILYWILGIVVLLILAAIIYWCITSKSNEGNPQDKDDTFQMQDDSDAKETEQDKLNYSAL